MLKLLKLWIKTLFQTRRSLEWLATGLLLLVLAGMIAANLGFPKTVDETMEASIFTADRRTLPCTVRLTGEVTEYPFNEDAYSLSDQIKVYAGEQCIAILPYENGNDAYTWTRGTASTQILRRDRSLLLVVRDLQTILPDQPSMPCLLAAPAMPREEAQALLETLPVHPEILKDFLWLTEAP